MTGIPARLEDKVSKPEMLTNEWVKDSVQWQDKK